MVDAQSFRLTVMSELGSRSGPPQMALWGELFYLPGKCSQFLLEGVHRRSLWDKTSFFSLVDPVKTKKQEKEAKAGMSAAISEMPSKLNRRDRWVGGRMDDERMGGRVTWASRGWDG